ncbi:MAG: ABC transporter substrate-binding protein [Chloroflexi bacterium]|nr:ABC transporter substrate-binding protein [Chloroflexota bacterium]
MPKALVRQATALLPVVVLLFVLGCSNAAPAAPTSSSAGAAQPASAGTGASGGGTPVEISLHYPVGVSGPLAKIIDGYMGEFNQQNPGIKVTPVYDGDYVSVAAKVLQLAQAGTPADVAIVNAAAMYQLTDANTVIPLDDLIAQSGGDSYINDFYPAFLANSQMGGHTWSIPFQRSTLVLYYNKDLFQQAGIANAPQSWDEMVQDAQKLTEKDASGNITRYGVGFPSSGTAYWEFQALAIESGQNVFDNNTGNKVFFNSPASVQSLQFLIDLDKKYNVSPPGAVNWDTLPSDFAAGKFGMIYHSTGSLTSVLKSAQFNVGVAILPKNQQYGTPTGGGNLYIMKGIPADHQAAAWKLIQWLSTPEREAQWSIDSGYVAPRKTAYDTPALKEYTTKYPQALVARDQLQYAQNELGTHEMVQVQKILSDAIQAGITGQAAPQEALDQAQQAATQVLSQYQT